MALRIRKLNQKGYTLIEMAIATLLLGIMATTVVLANRFANQQAVANQDRTFATEKAIQMYEELRALVNGNESAGTGILDNYSNHSTYDTVLTTDTHVDTGLASANPADPLSGNIKSDGNWRYIRQIEVNPVANDTQARQVTVKLFLYPGNFAISSANTPGTLLATVGGILRTSAQPNVATQVMDLYILQINNIPSWWSVLPTLATYMQADVLDLESRLDGVKLRTHYITRSSYGRDYYYKPETNSFTNPAESTHQQWVYFYPGICTQESLSPATDFWYFDPFTDGDANSLLLDGNVMVDGASYPVSTSQFNNDSVASYSVADEYNNAMRYPDEMAAYAAVTAAAAQATADGVVFPTGVTEISERMLLENMLSEPASFENAIIVNLHGELLPIPPLRDYSDAAKDPGNQLALTSNPSPMMCPITIAGQGVTGNTNVRVVTHPELLYYPGQTTTSTAVTVRLRVYAYYDSEDIGGAANLPGNDPRVPAISLFFPDSAVTLVGVTAEIGNNLTTGATRSYARVALASPYTGLAVPGDVTALNASGPMSINLTRVGPNTNQTLITLYNTPLRCPSGPVSGGSGSITVGGLQNGDMLYGCEYVPCSPDITTSGAPVSNNTNLTSATYTANSYTFTNADLAMPNTNSAGQPDNTARWIISVAMPVSQAYASGLTIYSGSYGANTTISGIHAIETRLGAAVTTSAVTISSNAVTIYPNLSRTYVWTGDAFMPPYTEQYQFMGDPRDCPYFDLKVGGVSISGASVTIGPYGYNWWFKNGSSGQEMASDGYSGFGQSGNNNQWNGNHVGIDMPRFYQIIRQGLLKTTSIWTGTNGWSWYYYGIGGEVGSDQSPRGNGVEMVSDLFMKSYSAGAPVSGYNDILGDGTWSGGLWVASNIKGSNSVTWYQRSWLGEIYPDKSYLNSWVTYGNLPSVANSAIGAANQPETFYLEGMNSVATAGGGGGSSDDGFESTIYLPNPQGTGANSFYDGQNSVAGGTNKTFNHESEDATGTLLNLGVTTYNIYPFPLAETVDVNRPWDFKGGNPPEWGITPYGSAGMTTVVDNPSVTDSGTSGVTERLFYDWGGGGVYPPTAPYGSGVVRMTQTNAGVTQVGYVVETGTAPSGNVGAQTLAETALVLAMRTFLDGGQMAATAKAGHIVQLPLVKIFLSSDVPEYNASQTIAFTVASPVTATSNGGGAVSVGMPVTDIWWAFNPNGLASYYTEEYPNYGAAMTTETGMYQESVSVIYNLKYSGNGGKNWYFVEDGSAAVTGICNTAASYAITNVAPWTYNWPVASGGTTLTQGDYELMVEAYRQNYGLHYSYDIQDLEVSW